MPKYTRNGVTIRSDKELTPDQLEEAFGVSHHPAPLKDKLGPEFNTSGVDENNALQDVLEGAGLPSHVNELVPTKESVATAAMGPAAMAMSGVRGIGHILSDSGDRASRYWDKLSDDPSIDRAAQTLMSPIPFVGNVMENADRGIAEGDPHAQGRLGGNLAAALAPKAGEYAPAVGRGAIKAGKFAVTNPTTRGSLIGAGTLAATHGNIEASLLAMLAGSGKVARVIKGLEELTTRGDPVDVSSSIKVDPVPIDPRINELKDLRLNNALAKEKGIIPQGESDINIGDVTELKRLRLERQLEAERGSALEREGGIGAEVDPFIEGPSDLSSKPPIAKGSAVNDIPKKEIGNVNFPEFPVKYKNVKLKNAPTPQPPNPYSREDPLSTGDELDTSNPSNRNDDLSLGASPDVKMGVPVKTHEELLAVQDLMATGLTQEQAVSIITSKPNIGGGGKLNPRALGTNPRSKGINPRALAEKRKGL